MVAIVRVPDLSTMSVRAIIAVPGDMSRPYLLIMQYLLAALERFVINWSAVSDRRQGRSSLVAVAGGRPGQTLLFLLARERGPIGMLPAMQGTSGGRGQRDKLIKHELMIRQRPLLVLHRSNNREILLLMTSLHSAIGYLSWL